MSQFKFAEDDSFDGIAAAEITKDDIMPETEGDYYSIAPKAEDAYNGIASETEDASNNAKEVWVFLL